MSKRIRPSPTYNLTVTPSTIAASEFGGAEESFEEIINFDLEYADWLRDFTGTYIVIKAEGQFPFELDTADMTKTKFQFYRETESVETGSNQLTFTFSVEGLSDEDTPAGISTTVTITGASGEGVHMERQNTVHKDEE